MVDSRRESSYCRQDEHEPGEWKGIVDFLDSVTMENSGGEDLV